MSDMQARFPNRDLVQLTNEDPTQVTVNTTFLQTFLDDASNEIDTYLESRFALPLIQIPSVLTRICCELAMFHLQALRPIHDLAFAKEIYECNIKTLNQVRMGELTLGLSPANLEPDAPENPSVVEVHSGGTVAAGVGSVGAIGGISEVTALPQRVFSRGSLIGF